MLISKKTLGGWCGKPCGITILTGNACYYELIVTLTGPLMTKKFYLISPGNSVKV
jgi:hypothetical protein